jgi:ABC-type lipoprotein release transport system permease subunit
MDVAVARGAARADAAARPFRRGGADVVGDRDLRRAGVRRRAAPREFGIRQALGADPRTILTLVLGQGMRTAGIGVVLGLAGSLALTRYLQSLLFGVGSYDVSVYGGVTILLLGVALAACYVPARRATRVAPTVALRES